jgi:predicted ATPase
MNNRFGGHGFYVLDEPEAALSPTRQLAMLVRMHELVRDKSQFVIATHSPILMAYPDARIYQIGKRGLEPVAYEETDHYLVARRFLADPRGQMKSLLE